MEGGREDELGNEREMSGGETGRMQGERERERERDLSQKGQREIGDGGGAMVERR